MTTRRPTAFMPLWIGDYLADTTHLNTEQHGAYLLLLMAYWRRGGPLPADDQYLCRIAGVTIYKWRTLRSTIAAFFAEEGGQWVSKRADEELAKAESKYGKRAEAGRKGGQATAIKGKRAKYSAPLAASSPSHGSDTGAEVVILAEKRQVSDSNATAMPVANEQQSQSESLRTIDSSPQTQNSEAIASDAGASRFANGELFAPKQESATPKPATTAIDLEAQVWAIGKAYLIESGVSPAQAGGLIGRWRKNLGYDDLEVMRLLRRAQAECVSEPKAFIEGCINAKRKSNGKANSGQFGRGREILDNHPLGNSGALLARLKADREDRERFDA